MADDSFLNSPRSRFRAAMVLAVVTDAVQIIGFPLFVEGALSPLDDVLDFITAVVLVRLLGCHWEFLPSLIAELVPGVDLIPFWTLAVANVYRKWKQAEAAGDQIQEQRVALNSWHRHRDQDASNPQEENLPIPKTSSR